MIPSSCKPSGLLSNRCRSDEKCTHVPAFASGYRLLDSETGIFRLLTAACGLSALKFVAQAGMARFKLDQGRVVGFDVVGNRVPSRGPSLEGSWIYMSQPGTERPTPYRAMACL